MVHAALADAAGPVVKQVPAIEMAGERCGIIAAGFNNAWPRWRPRPGRGRESENLIALLGLSQLD